MTIEPLLSFAESAQVLGVDADKVRRLVVEDRALPVVCVDAAGARKMINVIGMVESGAWRVDEKGRLEVRSNLYGPGRTVIGARFEPLDIGVLRIERKHVDAYRNHLVIPQAGPGQEHATNSAAAQETGQQPYDSIGAEASLPAGLDSGQIAGIFAGLWGTEDKWRTRLRSVKKGNWLNEKPVVTFRGNPGGQVDKRIKTLRNPIEVALGLIAHRRAENKEVDIRLRGRRTPENWRQEWAAYKLIHGATLGLD